MKIDKDLIIEIVSDILYVIMLIILSAPFILISWIFGYWLGGFIMKEFFWVK